MFYSSPSWRREYLLAVYCLIWLSRIGPPAWCPPPTPTPTPSTPCAAASYIGSKQKQHSYWSMHTLKLSSFCIWSSDEDTHTGCTRSAKETNCYWKRDKISRKYKSCNEKFSLKVDTFAGSESMEIKLWTRFILS